MTTINGKRLHRLINQLLLVLCLAENDYYKQIITNNLSYPRWLVKLLFEQIFNFVHVFSPNCEYF